MCLTWNLQSKKKALISFCYQTICHQNEPLWTVLAAYSISSQTRTGFFLYFFFSIWSNEHDACLIIRGMNGCMYLAREKSYFCVCTSVYFFSRRIRFLLLCPSGHRNWASVTDRASDDHYKVSRSRTCTRDIKEKLSVLGHTAQVVLLFGFSPLSPMMSDGRYTI